jgi:hypothetical protein
MAIREKYVKKFLNGNFKTFFQYNIDYASFNSVYKIDMTTDSAKQIAEEKKKRKEKRKKKTKKNEKSAQTDDESETDRKRNDVRLFGGSSPSLMMTPQPYPLYYQPYIYPRAAGPTPTLSTPLLWPPPPPPPSTFGTSGSPLPSRYTTRRRIPRPDGSGAQGSNQFSQSNKEPSPEEQRYWVV